MYVQPDDKKLLNITTRYWDDFAVAGENIGGQNFNEVKVVFNLIEISHIGKSRPLC